MDRPAGTASNQTAAQNNAHNKCIASWLDMFGVASSLPVLLHTR